jgi:hypothetical protein
VAKPLLFEKEITKKRVIEAIEEIEGDVKGCYKSQDGIDLVERKLRELRLALESKPLVASVP